MAKIGLRSAFEMETRNKYTKVDCEVSLVIDGRELPSMAVLGPALEAATELIQARVTESYKEVPARVAEVPATPTEPVKVGDPAAAVAATVAHVNEEQEKALEPVPFGKTKPWDLDR